MKRVYLYILKFLVVLGLFYFISRQVSFSEIPRAIKDARLDYVILAFFLTPLSLYLQYVKWRLLTRDLNPPVSVKQVIYTLFAGFFLGAVSPGRVGELGRGYLLKAHSQVKLAGLSAIDKSFNQLFILMFGLLALSTYAGQIAVILAFIAAVLLIRIFLGIRKFGPLLSRLSRRLPFQEHLIHFIENFDDLSGVKVWKLFLLSLVFYTTFFVQFILIIRAFSTAGLTDIIRSVALIFFLKSALPISLADLGVREAASVGLLPLIGVKPEAALNAALLSYVVSFFIPAILGGLVVGFKRREGVLTH